MTLAGCGGAQSGPTTPTAAPTPTPTPPVVVASGELSLLQGSFIDFDGGAVVSATSPDADVVFYSDTSASGSVWGGLLVRNGALLGIFGRGLPPSKAGCSAVGATGPNANVEVARLTAGTYLCVRTTLNRYSQVRIVTEAGPSAGPLLVIAFETYQ
jgi:hypothetical protein